MVLAHAKLCVGHFITCSSRNIVLLIISLCLSVAWNFIHKCRPPPYMEVALELCEGKFNFKPIRLSFRDIMERKLCHLFVSLFIFSFWVANTFLLSDLNRKPSFLEKTDKRT